MSCPTVEEHNEPHLARLARILEQGGGAGLVGAGTSIACGYPGWKAFLDLLIEKLPHEGRADLVAELDRMDIRTRVDKLAERLDEEYPPIFHETFRPRATGPRTPEWVRLLFDLNLRLLLTTNYTAELEAAARFHPSAPLGEKPNPVRWYQTVSLDRALRRVDGRLSLVYLHGCWDDPLRQETEQGRTRGPVVLGEESYQFAYEYPGAVRMALEAVCRTHTLLFVGASLADEDVKGVLRKVLAQVGPGADPHYALLPWRAGEDVAGSSADLRHRYGLVPIFYELRTPAAGGEDHSGLETLLRDLVARESRTTPRPSRLAAVPVAPGEYPPRIRIVHALLRAKDFEPRPQIQRPIEHFLAAEEGGILALVGIGGAGKTALVREALGEILARQIGLPFEGGVFVWSFYDQPEIDAFFRNLAGYVSRRELPEHWKEAQAYDAFRHACQPEERSLLILDGLEKLQLERPDDRRVHGSLTSPALRQLLLWLAQMPGAARAVVTTRFPLTDLAGEAANPRLTTLDLDALTRPQARTLLRRRGVSQGTERELDAILDHFGAHALTVDHVGGVISAYLGGDARRFRELGKPPLTRFEVGQTGKRLARVVAAYLGYLSHQEPEVRDTLNRVAVFPRPVGARRLAKAFLASNRSQYAGSLAGAGELDLRRWLRRLVELRFLHEERLGEEEVYALHPALRDAVLAGLGQERRDLAQAPRDTLRDQLDLVAGRPGVLPERAQALDIVEELIGFYLDTGELEPAFELYWNRLGHHEHLGWTLEEYARGERIVRRMVDATAPRDDLLRTRHWLLVTELALFLEDLGQVEEAIECLQDIARGDGQPGDPPQSSVILQNLSNAQLLAGHLPAAEASAREALAAAGDTDQRHRANEQLSAALAAMGWAAAALVRFASGTGEDRGIALHQLLLRLGRADAAFALAVQWRNQRSDLARAEAYYQLRRHQTANQVLGWIRSWILQFDHPQILVRGRLLEARLLRDRAEYVAARTEAEEGLRTAKTCGLQLYVIDFLVFLGGLALDEGDLDKSRALGSEALSQAADPVCRYFWGELDAHELLAQVAEVKADPHSVHSHRQAADALRGRLLTGTGDLIVPLLPVEIPGTWLG